VEREVRTVYDQPFDTASRLVIKATYAGQGGRCCSTVVRTALVDRADATKEWELDAISDTYEYDYVLTRIDPSAAVLCRTSFYGHEEGCFKLFIDGAARRLVKRVAFGLRLNVAFASDADAQRALGVTTRELAVLRDRNVFQTTPPDAGQPPQVFVTHPLPKSTYETFARARPARVRDNYGKDSEFDERIGAWQAERGGFWFGKTFYDGEGKTGVGALGFVTESGQYSLLEIPALFDWSVDTLLVEPDALWAGLVNHPEGEDRSGGLLRYDRTTQRAEIQKIPSVILRIVHVAGAVFLGTTHGLYVSRSGTVTWYHMEPDVTGSLVVITETTAK
jgi:hypothetical protein